MKPQGRIGDTAFCSSDSHGCPACPHPVMGPAIGGSSDVQVNGLDALRNGDPGIHAACCGSNQWQANGGAPYVLINGRAAFRAQDPTVHCGGKGQLVVGSSNVFVGDRGGARTARKSTGKAWLVIRLVDEGHLPVPCARYRVVLPGGGVEEGVLDSSGSALLQDIPEGQCQVSFPEIDETYWSRVSTDNPAGR